ncbi:ATP-binding protein [Gemmobacter sp.]|uniref:ATP-binding protein n=1 Tax=Gemmobacter sp. TaxID=1898957 RepID=UPI002AFDD561|nr:ATP-binding protein [Gemmobacter sp.]
MRRQVLARLAGVGLTVLAAVSASVVALGLARDVRDGIEALAIANSDSAQWTMAQLDVEMLAFQLEIRGLQAGTGSADQLRRRFDVLYGRIGLMGTSRLYAPLRGRGDFDSGATAARALLDWATPLIDGPDPALLAALPELADRADRLRPLLRNVTLSGQRAMAAESDLRRQEASATLTRVPVLTLVLFGVLAGLVVVLARLFGQARQRGAEQALTHGRLRAIVATSLDAILVVDARGRILDFNGAAEALFATSRLVALGQHVGGFVACGASDGTCPDGLPRAGSGLARVDGLRRDGGRFPAECSVGEAGSDDGLIRVCFLRDISDQLAAEQALVEARDRALAGERSNAEMLALMSHEIRTPLNGILGTLDLLQDTRLTARQRDYLRIVRNSGDLLLRHVNDVLDIARLDAGKMPVAHAPFDAAALLEDIAASQRPAAQRLGNRLAVAPGAPGMVLGDALKLRQVLLNLTGNAVKFTRDGEITLAARRAADDRVEFSVTDTGIGIASADLGRIFDDFVTLDSSYGRRTEGTGLGLPIARRMVRAMGGTIEVESDEGLGSRFRILLPLPAATDPVVAPLPGGGGGPAHVLAPPLPCKLDVLVVEDNEVNRFVVRQLLADDGHRVDEAVNGAEGVRLAAARAYDLILMDIGMPEMDGVAATRAIRAGAGASRATPIIALTANALPEDLARFEAAGMAATLVKPLSCGALRDVLAGVVPAPPDDAALPVMDAEQAAGLLEGLGRAGFDTLLGRFLDETGAGLEELASATERDDAAALADLAHRLAGSAAVFGAARLRAQLVVLEAAARAGEMAPLARGAAAALDDWPETRRAFGAI